MAAIKCSSVETHSRSYSYGGQRGRKIINQGIVLNTLVETSGSWVIAERSQVMLDDIASFRVERSL